MIGPHLPELTEIAERAASKLLDTEGVVVTRGILIMEILRPEDQHRGIVAVQLGTQGELSPWDVIGLISPVETKSRAIMTEYLMGQGDGDPFL